jgi:hypothetical protein
MRRNDWTFGRPPWPPETVALILQWVALVLAPEDVAQPDDEGPSLRSVSELSALKEEKLRREIRKITAAAELLITQLARERGKLLDAAEVEREWTLVGIRIRNAFANLPSQLLPLALTHGMPHEAAAAFEQQTTEIVRGILRVLSGNQTDPDPPDSDNATATDA